MKHLESVRDLEDNVSEWRPKGPRDMGTVTWRSEIISEEEGRHIKWQSLPDSMIDNAGSITFRDAGKFGTEIQAEISYKAPLGTPGEVVLKMIKPVVRNMRTREIRSD